jgi:hypothetical protein
MCVEKRARGVGIECVRLVAVNQGVVGDQTAGNNGLHLCGRVQASLFHEEFKIKQLRI